MALHFVGGLTPHTTAERLLVKTATYGLLGVDLFFVLSGFLITGLLLDAKKGRGTGPGYFRNFYARRTLRIFPLYYFVLTALFVLLPSVVVLPPLLERAREHQAWLWTYTANFYIGSRSTWLELNYVSHFWSLAIEEHFYLVWPIVVFLLSGRALERTCVVVIACSLALRIALALAGASDLTISVLTPCRVDTLCVGALLAAVARRPGGADALFERCGRAAFVLASAIVLLSAWCAVTKLGLAVLHQLRTTMYAMFFGAVTAMGARARPGLERTLFSASPLRFFGKYSYGLYVYHGLLTWFLHDLAAEERLDAALGSHWHSFTMLVHASIGVGLSTAVAVASYHGLEKPFLSLKRYFEVEPVAPSQAPSSPHPVRVAPADEHV
jgi:peptidoglycan/LPS O-acetylase OafA/YrhL